jgi:hypothetical protein
MQGSEFCGRVHAVQYAEPALDVGTDNRGNVEITRRLRDYFI